MISLNVGMTVARGGLTKDQQREAAAHGEEGLKKAARLINERRGSPLDPSIKIDFTPARKPTNAEKLYSAYVHCSQEDLEDFFGKNDKSIVQSFSAGLSKTFQSRVRAETMGLGQALFDRYLDYDKPKEGLSKHLINECQELAAHLFIKSNLRLFLDDQPITRAWLMKSYLVDEQSIDYVLWYLDRLQKGLAKRSAEVDSVDFVGMYAERRVQKKKLLAS